MVISKARESQMPDILAIYEQARGAMRKDGNPNQWINGYPSEQLLLTDIEKEQLFVMEDQNRIVGVFALITEDDPAYRAIREGTWNHDEEYCAIHRIGAADGAKGVLRAAIEYCSSLRPYIRIDTHRENKTMRGALEHYGFSQCGVIDAPDGSPRIAYDLMTK